MVDVLGLSARFTRMYLCLLIRAYFGQAKPGVRGKDGIVIVIARSIPRSWFC